MAKQEEILSDTSEVAGSDLDLDTMGNVIARGIPSHRLALHDTVTEKGKYTVLFFYTGWT